MFRVSDEPTQGRQAPQPPEPLMMPAETWNEMLDVYNACDEGRQALEAVVGDLNAPMPCDWPWALAVLSSSHDLPTYDYVGWGVGRLVDRAGVGVVAGADLRGVDLRSAGLRGVDLRSADLRVAYLRGADMHYANLIGADLRGADMQGTNLRSAAMRYAPLTGADLEDADLCGADLTGAQLAGADLRGADLRGADLTGACLTDADLEGARRDPSDPAIPGWTVVDGRLAVCDKT